VQGNNFQRTLTICVAMLIIGGTCGYVLIEGWPFADSIYMTLITLSTVGFGEVQELTPNGRLFTSLLITVSIVLMACWTAGITTILVSGELSGRFLMQKEKRMISRMTEHVIVCGGGVTALTVIGRMVAEGTPVVAITSDADEIESIKRIAPDMPVVCDDPQSEMALMDSNALAAKYLIAATESDYDNLLITISGKGLGNQMQVISFAHSTELASRMFKVGADEVICPLVIGGEHVAKLIHAAKGAAAAV
jgi:voltage-gated potassium channel